MLPIGPLMIEHRLIEKMTGLMNSQLGRIEKEHKIDPDFLTLAIDFLATYADKCHHGKEEDILFKTLAQKPLSSEHKKMMEELLQDHVTSRRTVAALADSKNKYVHGDEAALKDIASLILALVQLYAQHIKKEDKRFLIPVMKYLDSREQARMLESFYDFDRNFIHETYKRAVKKWEVRKNNH